MSLPFIALTLTTTGPDPRRDRVSAVSVVSVVAGGERTRFDAVVRTRAAGSDYQDEVIEGQSDEADWPEIAGKLRDRLAKGRVVLADRPVASCLGGLSVRLEQTP